MIDDSHYNYYLAYAALAAALVVAYIKIKSTDGVTITTKEFKKFQYSFLGGYGAVILAELIAVASFFHIMVARQLDMEQITNIYITTVVATTCWGILIEIFDIGSRKMKCFLSAALYGASLFSLYFGGHYEMILLSRIMFGAASALHHSSFEAYVIHQHTILGFPEDWLTQTFTLLPHVMAIAASASGPLGQIASSMATGGTGCITLIIVLSGLAMLHIQTNWEKDTNPPRFMWSNFLYTMSNTVTAVKNSHTIRAIILIGALYEATVMIITFYWAPWLSYVLANELSTSISVAVEGAGASAGSGGGGVVEEVSSSTFPYEIVFACYICASMLGNYLFQMASNTNDDSAAASPGVLFNYILIATSACYLIGSSISSPTLIFIVCIAVHLLMGAYWSCIGILRAQHVPPEYRGAPVTLTRVLTLLLTMMVLINVHHSPSLILICCGLFAGGAAYVQSTIMHEVNIPANI